MDAATKVDFASLFTGNANIIAGNTTGRAEHSNKLFESLLPVLGGQFSPLLRLAMFFHQMIASRLGVDPTTILTLFGFAWALNKVGRQMYMTAYGVIQENFMCNIHISSADDIYTHMMKWLAVQPKIRDSRSLMAESASKSAWEEEEELGALYTTNIGDGTNGYLNFSSQVSKAVGAGSRCEWRPVLTVLL
jgi:mitochondrial chaperone BCS1